MPRAGDGTYSKPAGATAVPNTKIESAIYNQTIDDLVTDANAPRPIVAGGTGVSTASAARTALGLAIGSDVQAHDANLDSLAGLTFAADQGLYTTGANTAALFTLTAAGRALLDDADAAAQRTTLGLGNIATTDLIDEDTMATNSATHAPSQQSVKAYVDAQAVFTKSYESSQQTITEAGALTLAHGMAEPPKVVFAFLKAIDSGFGYAAGDEIPINMNLSAANNASWGQSITYDATNIYIKFGASTGVYQFLRKDNGTVNLIPSNFEFLVRAYA